MTKQVRQHDAATQDNDEEDKEYPDLHSEHMLVQDAFCYLLPKLSGRPNFIQDWGLVELCSPCRGAGRNHVPMRPPILASAGAGIWKTVLETFPNSSAMRPEIIT